jgi:hypothetical protein
MSASKSTPSERAVEEKIPWHFLIPFMIVFGVFTLAISPLNTTNIWRRPSAHFSALGIVVICESVLTSLPFICFYFASVLGKLSFFKKRINLANMTWLYATTLCLSLSFIGRANATTFCVNYGNSLIADRILSPGLTTELLPWFMAPPTDVCKPILYGGVPTPWADLMPMIIFWWIFTSIYGLLMLSIATLFRKYWIDIEKVPFTVTLAAYELLVRTIPEKKVKFTRPFLLGLILGVIVWIPVICTELFPWFPDIYGYNVNTCGHAAYFVQPGEAIASLVGVARIAKEPLGVALFYFAPISVLFNTWFWWLVLVILSQVAYFYGYYTALPNVPGCCRIWGSLEQAIPYAEPFKWSAVLMGGVYSLTIFLLILSRGYIKDTLKAAFGKMAPSSKAEFEKNEPMSYRATYLLMIGTFIAAVVIHIICGMNPLSSLLTPISAFLFLFACTRVVSFSGIYYLAGWGGYLPHRLLIWPKVPEPLTRDFVLSAYFNAWYGNSPQFGYGMGGNFVTTFGAYKMASITGTSSKSVFKVLIASIIIYSFVVLPTWLWVAYTFGMTKLSGGGGGWCDGLIYRAAVPARWEVIPATEPWVPHFLAGFIIVGLFSWLHARFIWFPFEPIGFILGIGPAFELGYWTFALIAWILKVLTLRIGGSRLYEEFGAPMAGGYIAGHMLALIPGIILSRIRFFIPF